MSSNMNETSMSIHTFNIEYLYLCCLAGYTAYNVLLHIKCDISWSFKNSALYMALCISACWMPLVTNMWLKASITLVGILLHWNGVEQMFLTADSKAVLITGCDRGIGHELAKRMDSLGYQVFAGCLYAEGQGQEQLLKTCSKQLKIIQLDVTDGDQVLTAASKVKVELGGKDLWGIVNNAGICFIGNIETMTTEDINKIMAVNIMGPINVCRAFFPLLRKSKGRLVNIASNTGLAPVPLLGVYCASKSALATFSEVMRYEMKIWGIKVSTIIPSGYRTGILAYDKEAVAERWWRSASTEVREAYGKDCFTPEFKLKNHRDILTPDLTPIVNTIMHALCAKFPQTFYYSGIIARSLPYIYLHLPTVLSDPLMKLLADWFEFEPSALQNITRNK